MNVSPVLGSGEAVNQLGRNQPGRSFALVSSAKAAGGAGKAGAPAAGLLPHLARSTAARWGL